MDEPPIVESEQKGGGVEWDGWMDDVNGRDLLMRGDEMGWRSNSSD